MLKCILLDDEFSNLSYLKLLCESHPKVQIVNVFSDPNLFLEKIEGLDFECLILDIEMPGISGLDLAKRLKGKSVIFCTAYKEFASDAFELEAVDYLVKPVQAKRMQQALDRVIKQKGNSQGHRVVLPTAKGQQVIDVSKIAFFHSSTIDPRDKEVVLVDSNTVLVKNLNFESLLERIGSSNFIRINKREFVAKWAISSFDLQQVTLHLKDEVNKPIKLVLSPTYRGEFLRNLG